MAEVHFDVSGLSMSRLDVPQYPMIPCGTRTPSDSLVSKIVHPICLAFLIPFFSRDSLQMTSFRSPQMMNRSDSALLIIDVQEKLIPLIQGHGEIIRNIQRLIKGADAMKIHVCCTEQYPKGLGKTIAPIAEQVNSLDRHAFAEKRMFSCRECESLFETLSESGIRNILLCGIETHVCVAQTGLDLISQGFNVFICVDAVGARFSIDHETALRRLENCGATPTTTEAALFEWCEDSNCEEFKSVSKLVQESRQP